MQLWRLAAYLGCIFPCLVFSAPRTVVLTPSSLGQVRLGMHLDAAADALGNSELFEVLGRINGNHCYTIQSKVLDDSKGLTFLGLRTPDIQRIDVERTAVEDRPSSRTRYVTDFIRTIEGVKLGDSLSKVQKLYGNSSIYDPPRRFADGYYVVAKRAGNTGYAFMIEDATVVELRAGRLEVLSMSGVCQ